MAKKCPVPAADIAAYNKDVMLNVAGRCFCPRARSRERALALITVVFPAFSTTLRGIHVRYLIACCFHSKGPPGDPDRDLTPKYTVFAFGRLLNVSLDTSRMH